MGSVLISGASDQLACLDGHGPLNLHSFWQSYILPLSPCQVESSITSRTPYPLLRIVLATYQGWQRCQRQVWEFAGVVGTVSTIKSKSDPDHTANWNSGMPTPDPVHLSQQSLEDLAANRRAVESIGCLLRDDFRAYSRL